MPPYLEAYPRISIGVALREAREGRTHLLWRDRHDLVVGAARIESGPGDSILLHYAAEELPYADELGGEVGLKLAWKGSLANNARPFACCPECSRHADVLVLRQRCWACTGCHRLKHRSALLREEVRWSERLADLETEIAVGKPAGKRSPGFNAKLSERDDLVERLNGEPKTANSLYLTRISTKWIATPAQVMSFVT